MSTEKKNNKYLPKEKEMSILVTILVLIGITLSTSIIYFFIHLQDNIEVIKSIIER